MNITANWSYPTAFKLGRGRIKELAAACSSLGMKKPLLITDRGLAGMAITRAALDVLAEAGLGRALFADVDPNPNEINLEAGIKAYRDGGHDGVVAFGGGSGLDLGKCVASCGRPDAAGLGFRGYRRPGGPARASRASRRSSPCRPPARLESAAPRSSQFEDACERSSSIRSSCPASSSPIPN